jgi:hypothetical protein
MIVVVPCGLIDEVFALFSFRTGVAVALDAVLGVRIPAAEVSLDVDALVVGVGDLIVCCILCVLCCCVCFVAFCANCFLLLQIFDELS